MDPSRICFVGGDVDRLASVRIRGREIAERIGCAAYYGVKDPAAIPGGYWVYVCVKPSFGAAGVDLLSKKGLVVWDILDHVPPAENVACYLASTLTAMKAFPHLAPIHLVPHYHCNFEGVPNDHRNRRVAYIGSEHWYPKLTGIAHDRYFVSLWSREQVSQAYRRTGIAINHRFEGEVPDKFLTPASVEKPVSSQHILFNSGIKLINCFGFGIPSVSAVEPAYLEIAPECTLFTEIEGIGDGIARLRDDPDTYYRYRQACLALAPRYDITAIVALYQRVLGSL